MGQKDVEALYKHLDTTAMLLKRDLDVSYMDALIETGENIVDGGQIKVEDGLPHEAIRQQLTTSYQQINLKRLTTDEIRQAFQLAILRGERTDAIQANHQMTPDAIGFLVAYLIENLAGLNDQEQVLDLTVGTGNLLYTVLNRLFTASGVNLKGYGIDNDDTMLALANVGARLQHPDVELFHQDAIEDLVVPKVDVGLADLPIGYYPIDERAAKFATHAETGHSYAHHLLIEQSMRYTKAAGFGFFLVPSLLFQSQEATELTKWMTSATYLQGLLNLPRELFQDEKAQKAILILQNKGGQAKQAKKVMLGEFPSFKDQAGFQRFVAEISEWKEKNIAQ
ncbi:SAM-dependent methyltransferase [Loigolactobacillus backii]|uniref:class I SAM-dependent methyltransferase n=1 Tax=Loigolactobacillus backii TaxID=375175 RepID=UPI000C1CA8A1|nr:class I SAM-dependent methyltransferase [Loigolactobacillus backii]PIO83838.1 SAM-dependent methyltransferase [Loigolactobacillus backii]